MNPAIAGAEKINRNALNSEQERSHLDALDHVLAGGQAFLEKSGSALDAVTEAVSRLEECPLFNVGSDDIWKQQVCSEQERKRSKVQESCAVVSC